MIRVGSSINPIVFPQMNNFSSSLLDITSDGYRINHAAAGSDLFRYSPDYGKTWSSWKSYETTTFLQKGTFATLPEHVVVDYWCKKCGSATTRVYGELSDIPSIFPQLFVQGNFNMFGLDTVMENQMKRTKKGFSFPFVWNFPAELIFDIWGDGSITFGDIDGDNVLDRLPPNSQLQANFKLDSPPKSFVGWTIFIGDDLTVKLEPSGSWVRSMTIFLLLMICPVMGGLIVIRIFRKISYAVIVNTLGNQSSIVNIKGTKKFDFFRITGFLPSKKPKSLIFKPESVLIATLEYEIPDWKIKVRIGGLGVMSSLLGNHLLDAKLFWVVPMIGGKTQVLNEIGIEYPVEKFEMPIIVTILGNFYKVEVFTHQFGNITYFLLDSPIFRGRTQGEPYPARMDDFEAAIFYSCWNQCIAELLRREAIDLFHCNDYHCGLAPVRNFSKKIALSLTFYYSCSGLNS
jgi:alpha-1,3-glucan synthase